MAKTRARIIVKGEVQGVGYREAVKRLAMETDILGRVRNIEDGTVEILAEGRKGRIEEFVKLMDIKKYPVFVTGISTTYETYAGEFNTFTVIRDPDMQKEMFEAISGGTVELKALSEKTDNVLEKQDTMIGKQDTMIGKQDTMIGKQDTMIEKQDTMIEKQDETINVLNEFRIETKGSFADLGEKYHVVSKELLSIDNNVAKLHEDMVKSNANTAKLIEYIGSLVKDHIETDETRPR